MFDGAGLPHACDTGIMGAVALVTELGMWHEAHVPVCVPVCVCVCVCV